MVKFRPILGAGKTRGMTDDEFFSKVKYPVIATPKLDGIRCITMSGGLIMQDQQCTPVCRSLDPIPNDWIFRHLALKCPPGLDGEIITYLPGDLIDRSDRPKPFYAIQSDVMGEQGQPLFKFHVFDYLDMGDEIGFLEPYRTRNARLLALNLPNFIERVPIKICKSREEIEQYEAEMVQIGFEGICWRWELAPYKYGRSTLKEQALIKMKRFVTAEAVVIDSIEERHNSNVAEVNALGYKERSAHKAGMSGKGTLGALLVEDVETGTQFKVGSGFTAAQRADLWQIRGTLVGRVVTYKSQPFGKKDLPRIPVFIGFRDRRDT